MKRLMCMRDIRHPPICLDGAKPPRHEMRARPTTSPLKRDGSRSNRHRALVYCLRMISAQTRSRLSRGKTLLTSPDHALAPEVQKVRLRGLHIHIRAERIVLDEFAARLDHVAHQLGED